METLRLKPRQPVVDDFENWDDDDFLIDGDDLTVISQATSANVPAHRRDSQSSFRSDFESIHGDEEKHVHLPGDDEKSTLDAIAAATRAGIPIPKNVPPSALVGGTIKRLGGRKIKKIIQEDWVDDLEFPDAGQTLKFKQQDSSQFPEVLRQVSNSAFPSPTKTKAAPSTPLEERKERPLIPAGLINLDRFRDNDDDDDFFGDGAATIKVSKRREPPKPIQLITPPTPQRIGGASKIASIDDDFEQDLELPVDGTLRLSTRREIPKTPSLHTLDDLDWAEGSLGTRFGGTRRDAQSTRSSSVSAFSPSIASSITAESEDETFDGLVLPHGPLDFERRLNRQRTSRSPERIMEEPAKEEREEKFDKEDKEKEDFFAGLEIGDRDVFDSKKLTLHRNIQLKETRPTSPSRPKISVALKFTNKPVVTSRLPRPMGPPMVSHERSHTQSSLEPVSESGGPITHSRRSLSRLGHSSQSSVTSINTPTTPSSGYSIPSTPRKKELGSKTSVVSLREPTTTSAQLLRLKRSLPVLRGPQSPARPPPTTRGFERPPSRTELATRPGSSMRPKTPVERMRSSESAASQARKPPLPFLPAGASASQSHNIAAKSSRVFRRHDSENSIEFRPNSRAVSRSTVRSPSPRKYRPGEKISTDGPWHQLSKPRRNRQFGDGHELDGFDDLPTSSQAEAKFLKQPVGAGPPRSQIRSRMYQNILPDRNMTPSPSNPYTPRDNVPSFARDTAASRIARETSLAQRVPSGPLAPLTTQRVAQLSSRSNYTGFQPQAPQLTIKSKKSRKPPQRKPHLISNLNPPKESKVVKGMCYNPETFRWEGNDNVLGAFDPPASSPSTASVPQYLLREQNSTPRPALITNIGTTKGVQVVGGMVFDPQNMCWLKLDPKESKGKSDPMDGFNALDDEEDVFKNIPDLEDHTMESSEGGRGRVSDVKDDWLVGEEFDVGPEFIRRQREEEERWRKKCYAWVSPPRERGDAWKWAIRDIVAQTDH